ncbi:hypothetical protein [Noviherbaspirillum malthae]|uniref:hypothetical protein n=1 Tax=Noviherbaspirillum malthae TaxID=1260987 RepID=UPI00188FB143|nr:hypothetical protein [Noviherbaspirillum malthae]
MHNEEMCIDVFDGEMEPSVHAWNGGDWFVGMTRTEQAEFVALFRNLPIALELETSSGTVGIVHAECPVADWNDLPIAFEHENADAYIAACLWSRSRYDSKCVRPVENVRAVVVGHYSLDRWTTLGNHLYIDTGAVYDGRFTVLDAETLRPARSKAWVY